MTEIRYRPEIDGLRAFAVLPVILFHLGFMRLSGGFLGVDVFFVISGYLITSILLKDYDQGTFSFSRFWIRRIRRIFPPLAVMLIITAVSGRAILFVAEQKDLGWQGLSAVLSFANISFWRLTGNYWGAAAENSPLLHTWSLSVEEQFYFLFPFIIFVLMRYARKQAFIVIGAMAAVSYGMYLYGSQTHPSATFYLLPTRAWELASGCLLAMYSKEKKPSWSPASTLWLSAAGFFAIIISYVIVSGANSFPGYLTLPVLGTVAVIAFAGDQHRGIKKVLSFPPLVYIGKISYSLYLWHWPVIIGAKKLGLDISRPEVYLPLVALIFFVSVLSYNFVEQKARQAANILAPAAVLLVISISLSSALHYSGKTYDISGYDETLWKGQLYNVNPVPTWNEGIRKRMSGIKVPERERSNSAEYATGGIIKKYGGAAPQMVVLGDSHSLMWSGMLDEVARDLRLTVSFYGADGISPFVRIPLQPAKGDAFLNAEQREAFDSKRLEHIKKWKPAVVVVSALWSRVEDAAVAGDLIRFLGENGSKVILIGQPPELAFGDNNALQYLAFAGKIPKEGTNQYLPTLRGNKLFENGRAVLRQLAAEYPFCRVVEVEDIFARNSGTEAWVLEGKSPLYIDDDHLSQHGALKLKGRLRSEIGALLRK